MGDAIEALGPNPSEEEAKKTASDDPLDAAFENYPLADESDPVEEQEQHAAADISPADAETASSSGIPGPDAQQSAAETAATVAVGVGVEAARDPLDEAFEASSPGSPDSAGPDIPMESERHVNDAFKGGADSTSPSVPASGEATQAVAKPTEDPTDAAFELFAAQQREKELEEELREVRAAHAATERKLANLSGKFNTLEAVGRVVVGLSEAVGDEEGGKAAAASTLEAAESRLARLQGLDVDSLAALDPMDAASEAENDEASEYRPEVRRLHRRLIEHEGPQQRQPARVRQQHVAQRGEPAVGGDARLTEMQLHKVR